MDYITRYVAGVSRLTIFLLCIFLMPVCPSFGQSRQTVLYETNDLAFTPTNILSSNILAGANVTIAKGAKGRLTISAAAVGGGGTNFDGVIITNKIFGPNYTYSTSTNVPTGILSFEWGTNIARTISTITSNGLHAIVLANDITTSNGVVAFVMVTSNNLANLLAANDTFTSNALRTAYLASDITTSNGLISFSMTMSNVLRTDISNLQGGTNGLNSGLNALISRALTNAAGPLSSVQFNSNGVLSGSSGFIFTNGNVGVGSASPGSKLSILGNNPMLTLVEDSDNAGSTMLRFSHAGVVSPNESQYVKTAIITEPDGLFVGGANLHFALNTVADPSIVGLPDSKMVIRSSGNVGIGTTNPAAKLDVVGTVAAAASRLTNSLTLYSATASRAAVFDAFNQLTNASGTPDGTKFLRDDNTYAVPPGGGSLTTNANQFGPSVTLTIKSDALLTNTIHLAEATNETNVVIQQNIGQAVPMISVRGSNNVPVFEIDNRGFMIQTDTMTNYSLGGTRQTPNGALVQGVGFHGGQDFPSWTDDRARTFTPQVSLFDNEVYYVIPGSGTAPFSHGGGALAASGGTVISHEAPDELKPYMVKISSAATSNSTAGICINVNLWNAGAHNGSSRVGGGFFFSRWMYTNHIGVVPLNAISGTRNFVGLANAASPNFTNIVETTNATGQYLGLMADLRQSATMFFTCRDGTAEFRTNTTIPLVATNLYEVGISQGNTNRLVRATLRDLTSRLEWSGVWSNNVPTNFMKPVIMSKNATNRANDIYFNKLYLNIAQNPRWN